MPYTLQSYLGLLR